jgi:hypothetical protein
MKTLKFPAINPKIRRFLIFSATVGAGSVLILYDLPAEVLIGATVATGCLMLILVGAVHLSDLRPATVRETIRVWREKRKQTAAAPAPAAPVQKGASSGRIGAVLGALPAAVHDGVERLKATLLHREKTFQEIDAKLDSTVTGQDVLPDPAGALPVTPVAGGGVSAAPADPLLDVSMEDLENLNLDDPEAGSGTSPSLDIPLDTELPMAPADDAVVSGILEANSSELEEFSELGDIEELDGLDSISLDELDLPDGADLTAEVDGLSPEPAAEPAKAAGAAFAAPAAPSAPPEPVVEEPPQEENMLAFAMGGGSDDALMDLLKSDSKKQRKEDYNSLLRDMKDVKVSADDLVTELQDTLAILKSPGKKVKKQND